jgi:hypothetical protein
MSADGNVYTGVWHNHAKGPILGATVTVTPSNGLLLVAVLALFVSLAGTQSWGIVAFFVHQIRMTQSPRNGLYHQQQAVLRNAGAASSTIWQLGKVAWAWRSQGVYSSRRTAGLMLLGLTQFIIFNAAGIFTSRLARVSNQVLIQSPSCGIWDPTAGNDLNFQVDSGVFTKTQTVRDSAYVQQCLSGNYQSSPECNTFQVQALPFTTRTNASCPFSPKMCTGPEGFAVEFDTGLLDSRDDLGVNSKQIDRIQYRKVTTCSPITSDGYVNTGVSTLKGRAYNYTAAFYGINNDMPSSMSIFGGIPNATYVHSDYKTMELRSDADLSDSPYTVA